MPIDALTLVTKVIERAAEKSGQLVPLSSAGGDEAQQVDLLVDTLASHLLELCGIGNSANGGPSAPSTSDLERICADQIARNTALARALGACDCWGELPACQVCRGRGAPGWRTPEAASFGVFVRPVLRKLRSRRLQTHGAPRPAF